MFDAYCDRTRRGRIHVYTSARAHFNTLRTLLSRTTQVIEIPPPAFGTCAQPEKGPARRLCIRITTPARIYYYYVWCTRMYK